VLAEGPFACNTLGNGSEEFLLRVKTLERLILLGNGLGKADDTLPCRYFDEPVQGGPAKGEVIDRSKFAEILGEYYRLHGWDAGGVPTESTLKKLGLYDI
jgi:aldehyde:ferredoxin oxidoreductase